MILKDRIKVLFQNRNFILSLWIALAIFSASKQYVKGSYNNYLIFKHVFYHSISQENLYQEYPQLYNDSNFYGPVFSVIIAPFALAPDWLGTICWNILMALTLFYSIQSLSLSNAQKIIATWLVTNELFTSMVNFQFNPAVAATLILAYSFIQKEKDFWAALVIMIGTFVKIYSLAGLAFFFFSKHKVKLLVSCILWSVILFGLPIIFTEPSFIIQSYRDWGQSILIKNDLNVSLDSAQDISISGLVRRSTRISEIPYLFFIIPGFILFFIPYANYKFYNVRNFQVLLLCSVLLFIVIFSSGSESSTYIIAFTGVAIWLVLHDRPVPKPVVWLMTFAFILTSLSPTVFLQSWREVVEYYSLKALPCVLIWFYLSYELIAFSRQKGISKIDIQ